MHFLLPFSQDTTEESKGGRWRVIDGLNWEIYKSEGIVKVTRSLDGGQRGWTGELLAIWAR